MRPANYYPGCWDYRIDFPHNRRSNIAWLDGHVEGRMEADGIVYLPNAFDKWWKYSRP
jgi:prepilin-type processing-associated H-X9-DG protein